MTFGKFLIWVQLLRNGSATRHKNRAALYERMIEASSNEGDLVMDPFAGCGTTIDAAHTLNRFWIGIDLTILFA